MRNWFLADFDLFRLNTKFFRIMFCFDKSLDEIFLTDSLFKKNKWNALCKIYCLDKTLFKTN